MKIKQLKAILNSLSKNRDECEVQIASYGNPLDATAIHYDEEENKFIIFFDQRGT